MGFLLHINRVIWYLSL